MEKDSLGIILNHFWETSHSQEFVHIHDESCHDQKHQSRAGRNDFLCINGNDWNAIATDPAKSTRYALFFTENLLADLPIRQDETRYHANWIYNRR